jgi:hypothetical protein
MQKGGPPAYPTEEENPHPSQKSEECGTRKFNPHPKAVPPAPQLGYKPPRVKPTRGAPLVC